MRIDVAATLTVSSPVPATATLQIAVAAPESEQLTVLSGGSPVEPEEFEVDGARVHRLALREGPTTITYSASAQTGGAPRPVTPADWAAALRPSRYCPSDRLAGFAAKQFGYRGNPLAKVRAITAWVHDHLSYEAGASGPSTDALDTLLAGAGVCRDYAHLVATLCRALDVPARVAAVYAPGLSPMDFHLVVETALDGVWRVWDATRLAPRQTLIRIATGRDAADTALATTLSGLLTMPELVITAVAADDLPYDDHTSLVSLA